MLRREELPHHVVDLGGAAIVVVIVTGDLVDLDRKSLGGEGVARLVHRVERKELVFRADDDEDGDAAVGETQ